MSDTDKTLAKSYGAFDPASSTARRAAFVIGKDGKITHAWEKVNASEFPAEVLAIVGGKSQAA